MGLYRLCRHTVPAKADQAKPRMGDHKPAFSGTAASRGFAHPVTLVDVQTADTVVTTMVLRHAEPHIDADTRPKRPSIRGRPAGLPNDLQWTSMNFQ